MAAKKMKKITKRWLINSFGVMLIIVVAMVVAISISVRSYYYNGARQFLLSRSDAVATLLENYSRDSSVDFSVQLRRLVEDYEYKSQSELMAIDGDKNVIITSSGFEPGDALEMPDYDRAYSSQTGVGEFVGYAESGEKVMAVTVMSRIISDDLSAMRYVVSLTRIDRQIWTLVLFACLLGLAIVLFVLYTSFYFINSIIIPIGGVGQTAKQIAQGDFAVRLEVETDDEIGELCTSINNMAEELSNSEKIKNDFISSVSHELRTPLTAIRGYLELLEREESPALARKYLGLIAGRVEAMSRLTEELFRYSVVAAEPVRLQPVDFSRALEESLVSFYGAFQGRGIAPEISLPEGPVPRQLDGEALSRVLSNILSNALKYSGGDLKAALTKDGRATFENSAPGLNPVSAARLFDRFYTVETGRDSTGLGLSIAKLLTERMGGAITASWEKGRLRIELSFPE